MALAKDIQLEDNDLVITNGDFAIGFSDQQHIEDIINDNVGNWKQYPTCGVGIKQYQASSGQEQIIERLIKLQLQNDGYNVDRLRVFFDADGTLTIDPQANRI
jgi:hypothetical protein